MTRRDLLEWLAKEDYSMLGECHGPLLDELVADGLAKILPNKDDRDYLFSPVTLTPSGRAALEEKE